ncbi:hypothetical protein [Desulfosarcina variabilis]
MTVKGLGFVDSVKYLHTLLPDTPDTPTDQRLKLNQLLGDIGKRMSIG